PCNPRGVGYTEPVFSNTQVEAMEIPQDQPLSADMVSYESAPVAEVQIDDMEYRVDTGLGSVVAISRRAAGASSWVPIAQGRWDGVRLRARALEHAVTAPLERALARAMAEQRDGLT